MALFNNLGFNKHPFTKTNADEEEYLDQYFVPPPFFDAIIGDALDPTSSIVLAPRGAGKTAQRRMVEAKSIELGYLAVTYDRFEFNGVQKVTDVTLQYHLRNIITRVLLSLLSYMSSNMDVVKNLNKEEKKELKIFIQTYLGEMTGNNIQEIISELKALPEKFKEFWKDNVGFLESFVNVAMKHFDLENIDLPKAKQEEKKLSETYKHQLELLYILSSKMGFKSIYILVDKPDETEQTGNHPEKTYSLIQPMIRDLELLGINGYCFKFFLWDRIKPFYQKDARPDRVSEYNLNWNRSNLKKALSLRIKTYSNNVHECFDDLMDSPCGIDDIICLLANGSPRNMVRLCEKIFAIQGDRDPTATKISINTVDMASIDYCDMIIKETYGEQITKDIQRIGREIFTTNFVANEILKITTNGARSKIKVWSDIGIVSEIGKASVPTSTKPVNLYCVVDGAAVRLINRAKPLNDFIKDSWLTCSYCDKDNLVDIDLFPEANEPICRNCSRPLI
ncbi:hypothetical protein IHC87_06915 [Photobacterium damselae subsp. damselae]|uniref:P-loop ATPase, Sll1717 family n=1 Tax=Photobacterium damselae TaxID=38293 RepID=UPI001F31CDAD|nr:hypothetical protein [Photobacterium damselae]UJZ95068.1 hypothetical protein IHC87_06915 [Photobacterium damselae subsp. damselae]UJZ99049.1 hypothetical protein IHC88_06905 [Photobacterium damselae subsp. damselae]